VANGGRRAREGGGKMSDGEESTCGAGYGPRTGGSSRTPARRGAERVERCSGAPLGVMSSGLSQRWSEGREGMEPPRDSAPGLALVVSASERVSWRRRERGQACAGEISPSSLHGPSCVGCVEEGISRAGGRRWCWSWDEWSAVGHVPRGTGVARGGGGWMGRGWIGEWSTGGPWPAGAGPRGGRGQGTARGEVMVAGRRPSFDVRSGRGAGVRPRN